MGRGWRPLVVGGAIVVATFGLAKAHVFSPSTTPASTTVGDAARGAVIFERTCSGCHGPQGGGGGVGPILAGAGLDAATVSAMVQQGGGVMPAGLVSGEDEADVVAYVVSISNPGG
jgi:mono/diheme cytochrome c family protein